MKEREKRKQRRNCRPSLYCRRAGSDLVDSKFLQIEAYIDAQCKGSYKKNKNRKAIIGVKWKKTKNQCKQGIA